MRIGDEATLKHVYYSPDKLILQPENPAFPPIVLIGEEMNTAIIEGKAVGLCRKI
ncbi:LexA family protein [Hominenteromicrobium sp.]|uniref:LexA family protein n=1 Tax=Hominenteromicrobium sp. TaxID=3073581 RepID=UPI003AF036FA